MGNPVGSARLDHQAPTHRVPGASVAARAAQAGNVARGAQAAGGGPQRKPGDTDGAAPAAATRAPGDDTTREKGPGHGDRITDEDGYQLVRSRSGWRKARGPAGQSSGEDTSAANGGDDLGPGASGAQRDEGEPAGDAEEPNDDPATPTTLHKAWQSEVGVVRRLKQQGLGPTHPAMRAACEARDMAERAWRGAKEPPPTAIRLARAQAKLDRALEIQGESHKALAEYEAAHKERLAALQARLEEDRARVRTRRQQLEEVQAEVGAGASCTRTRTAQDDAARQVHDALCGTVAPTIAALVEQLDSSLPAWSVLNGLLGTLATSKDTLEKAFVRPHGTQEFDIADGGDAAGGEGDGWWEGESDWSESHELPNATPTGGEPPGGQGADPSTMAAAEQDQCMGTDNWWDKSTAAWDEGARWQECGHGKWTRASWADSWEQEQEAEGPAVARRRLEPAPPPSTTADDADTHDAAGAEQRRRQHGERAQRIILAAINAGVQPVTSTGEELHLLDPNALDAWAAENLPAGTDVR